MDLKHKSGEGLFFRTHDALFCLTLKWSWCDVNKAIQQFLYTEIIDCAAKEHRAHLACQIFFTIKFWINMRHGFEFDAQFICSPSANVMIQQWSTSSRRAISEPSRLGRAMY